MAWPTSVMLGRPDHPTARGLLLPLIAALGILALTAASFSLFPRWLLGGENKESSVADASSSSARLGMYSVKESSVADPGLGLPSYSGLIDPHNGDNGTDPAQTTTVECTGDYTLPVLAGVDVVAYFSLTAGAPPVYGTDNYMALFGEYRFFFSSIDNLWAFEADPVKYIPAWGGFCSYGIANEPVWTDTTLGPFGNPSKWLILPDGRLHIFRSSVPLSKFGGDVDGYMAMGNEVWFGWFGEKGGPLNTACFCADTICDDQ